MGKIVVFLLILLAVFLTFPTPVALADDAPQKTCPGEVSFAEYETNTPKDNLTNADNKARFIVNIGTGKVLSDYNYKMEFRCGAQSFTDKQDAKSVGNGKEIYFDLRREKPYIWAPDPCEFSLEPHEIWITTEKKGESQNYPVCRTSYPVTDQYALCKLTLFPDPVPGNPYDPNNNNGITPATTLLVHGENLVKNAQYNLFFDNRKVQEENKGEKDLGTPRFDFFIPPSLMTVLKEGKYQIDIRRHYFYPNPIHPGKPDYGSPLCPVDFTMGTPGNPGKVISQGDIGKCSGGPNCSSGKSQECPSGTKPSVKTAIGCIHTNPGDLIQDVLKFGLGIGGGLAFLMMLLGAFQMLTSAGNPETLQAGRERLTSAVIGLLFVIFAVLLLQIIGVDILGILQR